jgi:DNA-binding transcriptional MerR regulator
LRKLPNFFTKKFVFLLNFKKNSMANKKESAQNQRFIEIVEQLKKMGVSYRGIDRKAKLSREGFTNDVLLGRSSAGEFEVINLLNAFPEVDPDFKEENIVEAIKRIEQEKETLKDEIKELQAAVFKLQAKCK